VRLAVVPGRSRIDLTTRPALPGVRLVVESVDGNVGGVLHLRVRALTDADPPAVALPSWLATEDGSAAVEARLGDVEVDGDAVRARVEVRAGGHVAVLRASGRWRTVATDGDATGPVEAVGTAVVDLRGLGFGLPPLITYVVQVRWRLLLIPDGGPAAAEAADTAAGNQSRRPAH
jgi:hypothetical protein